jgi:protein TonB
MVAALPEPKAEPPPKPPEPAKVVQERPKPKPPVRTASQHPADEQPAPRTTAPPRAERSAPSVSGATAGAAAAAALPSYRMRLAAHLHRFQQYPASARSAGEQGTAMLNFTIGRGGQVLSSRLVGSSGHPALDAETLATIRRAQPLPPFPPELTQASLNFTVPMQFSLR